ncbi:2-oxoglutarate dehydrogenase complex dihydrolipoyllysine-residue succinyltransferase [Salipaludibacillus sp. LMS25]|jgi:2-oxoglutarate dehydrogenase E2 component (dihydrolipoamide succinyltransferase)|uniref:2-oxoglutarate dehydrogenase complex dihydrolipoyllysine-residue succinyltransferase n=1 Tax=Salipaludibacillus sp. LMS25 TaxID=2924031 RepID=UPI0020D0DF47|nr:2-oxoglutarate dehydrogenase complex dihydrolipoyllysine-residue succinyltransferase [Salipaludibacillus sp. LMS25]UTR14718.1 2-oxoglutarate dehydrogenase complex dihydrolipoyllysine-residue succinyltransferase [Salipaludibacillus sp. LMS25]
MLEIKVPELAESVTEGTVAEWLKQPGDYVEKGEDIVELETDKVNVEISAEEAGILEEAIVEPGNTVKVGDIIARMNTSGEVGKSQGKSMTENNTDKHLDTRPDGSSGKAGKDIKKSEIEHSEHERPLASPATRKYAREQGIKLNEVQPRDPLGRIRKEDVDKHKENNSKTSGALSTHATKSETKGSQDMSKPVERIKMSRRRQTIAKRLVEAQQTAAMLTTFNEVDMTNLMDLRKRRKDKFLENNGVKLGFMSFFTKAVIGALKKYPYVNAEIDGDEIILKKFYDIGVAVSTEDGLIVPVVRDADRLDFAGIEKEIGQLAEKAHEKKLALNELQGGTFTITNGGVFGSLWSTPILNTPQVGILGMHKIQMRPVAIDNERFENRPMMYIALSYDHRIIDGKDAVGFLVKVKELIEDPETLLLEG